MEIVQPYGQADILIGIHRADIHLVVAQLEHHRVNGLSLLSSLFGSGFLLEKRHPDICPEGFRLCRRAHSIGHATVLTPVSSKPRLVNCVSM